MGVLYDKECSSWDETIQNEKVKNASSANFSFHGVSVASMTMGKIFDRRAKKCLKSFNDSRDRLLDARMAATPPHTDRPQIGYYIAVTSYNLSFIPIEQNFK